MLHIGRKSDEKESYISGSCGATPTKFPLRLRKKISVESSAEIGFIVNLTDVGNHPFLNYARTDYPHKEIFELKLREVSPVPIG